MLEDLMESALIADIPSKRGEGFVKVLEINIRRRFLSVSHWVIINLVAFDNNSYKAEK